MDDLRARIAVKKAELDRLRPVVGAGFGNLEHIHDLELTYTSNAIEGNTLSAAETALVIEQGITIGGKPLKDHLEAIDHYAAIGYVRALARRGTPLVEADLARIRKFVASGKPVVAIRTSSHAFAARPGEKVPEGVAEWTTFDKDILGGNYRNHYPESMKTTAAATGTPLPRPLPSTTMSGSKP